MLDPTPLPVAPVVPLAAALLGIQGVEPDRVDLFLATGQLVPCSAALSRVLYARLGAGPLLLAELHADGPGTPLAIDAQVIAGQLTAVALYPNGRDAPPYGGITPPAAG